MESNKIHFGTNPKIGYLSVGNGLSKYKTKLITGITDAFDKLSLNGQNDEFVINIKRLNTKNPSDIIDFSYFNTDKQYQSNKLIDINSIKNLSKKNLSKFVQNIYQSLKNSNTKAEELFEHPIPPKKRIPLNKLEKIANLITKYGFDDWTCA